MIYAPFIDGSSLAISPTFQGDYTQNAYVENASSSGAKTEKALIGAPGTVQQFDLGDGPIRGQLSLEGYEYIVAAGNFWQKDPSDIITLLGTISNDGLPVKMVANTTQIFIRSAGSAYVNQAGTVTLVTTPCTSVADIDYLDGYFIALDDDGSTVGGQFFISSPEDCTTWDALDFGTAPASNNKLRALSVIDKMLYVIGSITTQPFYNSGNADFPIVPSGPAIMVGTTARDSVTKVAKDPGSAGSTIFMLTENADGHAQVAKIVGFAVTIVSTPQIDRIFQSYTKISDCIGWAFQYNGHTFYQANFPDAQASWRFDASNPNPRMAWAAVTWYNQATGLQEAHRGVNHGFNLGRHLVGDRQYGIVWLLDQETYSDGDPTDSSVIVENFMQRIVLLPSEGTTRMFLNRVELLCETGVGDGTGSGQGHDPVAELYVSYDGGRTFEDPQSARLGLQGEYNTRVDWPRQGSGLQLCVKVEVDAPVKRLWSGLDIEMRRGNNK